MSMIDAMTRIDQIEATMAQLTARFSGLSGASATAAASSTGSADAAASTASAAAFSTALGTVDASSAIGTATATAGAATGTDIVNDAKKYIGVPYVYGGEDSTGMDCSGLVQRVLRDVGISAPRVVSQQQYIGTPVASLADAQPGDLIITKNADHIVIYAGNGQIIHAPYPGRTVDEQKNYLTDADIQTIRRVAPAASPASAAISTASLAATTVPTVADLIAAAQRSLMTATDS
jgi:cell wall-associated NlpC family hydrolase